MKVEIEPEVFEKMKELYADYLEEKRIGEKVSTLRSLSNNIFTVEYAHKKEKVWVRIYPRFFGGFKLNFEANTFEEALDLALDHLANQ